MMMNGTGGDALATPLPDKDEISRRVAEARRLVANANTQAALSSNPYIVSRTSLRCSLRL